MNCNSFTKRTTVITESNLYVKTNIYIYVCVCERLKITLLISYCHVNYIIEARTAET